MEEQDRLYNNPKYYDVAFGWDSKHEIKIIKKIFETHVPFPVERILEPACGTGRFLVTLPSFGYTVVGYDSNGEMLAFARKRISEDGLYKKAIALIGEMESSRFAERFDSAINLINSFAYLLHESDIMSHLLNMAASLRREAVYIIQLSCMYDDLSKAKPQKWSMKKFGIEIETTWQIIDQIKDSKTCYQRSTLNIIEKGREWTLEEDHRMRLWTYDDLKKLVSATGKFDIIAIYDEKGGSVPLDSHINGEMGNLYFVLHNKI